MPKGTGFHRVHDAAVTDKKLRPHDEGIYEQDKQEFQGSEQSRKSDARSEEKFIADQDKAEQDKDAKR